MEKTMNRICTTKKCGVEGKMRRGVCKYCYGAACKLVFKKKTTWEELEERGLVKPIKNPSTSPFRKVFDEKNGQK